MSKPNLANRPLKRKKWLGSASVLAAATALAAITAADNAKAQSQITGPRVHSAAPDILSMRRSIQQLAPHEDVVLPLSVPRVPDNLPVLPNAPANPLTAPLAPSTQPQVTIAPAPTNGTISVSPPQPIIISGQSPQPVAAPVVGQAGINVSASASFDDNDVTFTPGVAADTINVLAPSAIVEWETFNSGPDGTEVTFLGALQTLNFTSSLADYTVLNRIFTPGGFENAVRIDGNVNSTVLGGVRGGNVWFYSPTGIVVGAGANFNVGSLLLSTSAIADADVTTGDLSVAFTGVSQTDSFIRVEDTASITANNNNSYVAMIAPRIEMAGDVSVNGSTAYVAAEQATMTIQNGLFDISVDVGSEDANGIVHTGSTGGQSSTGVLDEQAIYFVAVPKNTAINMLVGGSVGYDAAASASVENGEIILTTGNRVERTDGTRFVFDPVVGGFISVASSSNSLDLSVDGGAAGSITLENMILTSSTDVFAEDTVTLQAGVTNDTDFVRVQGSGGDVIDLNLNGGNAVNVLVANEGRIDVSGSLNLVAGDTAGNGGDVTINLSQDPTLTSPSGGLFTGLGLNVNTSAFGLDDFFTERNNGGTGIGQDAVAGNIAIDVSDGATLSTGGALNLGATAQGGKGESQNGSATAGDIAITLAGGNIITAGGVSISTSAIRAQAGKIGGNGSGLIGADGAAGDITINLLGGASDLGVVTVVSNAEASVGSDDSTAQSNDAIGSDFTLNVSGGTHVMSELFLNSSVSSRESYDGISTDSFAGQVARSTATISVTNAGTVLDILGDLTYFGSASGDLGTGPSDAVNISVIDTNSAGGGGLSIGGSLTLFTDVDEGAVSTLAKAGSVALSANNGTFTVGALNVTATADGSFFASTDIAGSDFEGGDVSITANNGGVFTSTTGGNINVTGVGFTDSTSEGTGIGQGGTITVLADDAAIVFGGNLELNAGGFATSGENSNGEAGQGLGGTIRATVQGNQGSLSFGDLTAGTNGSFQPDFSEEPEPFDGTGSRGQGGLTEFNILGGTFSANNITVSSIGQGGPGGAEPTPTSSEPFNSKDFVAAVMNGLPSAASGGAGIGGNVVFNLDGGDATMATLTVSANGIGGDGGSGSIFDTTPQNGGSGGAATGGTATFNAISGSLTVIDTLTVEATGNSQVSGTTIGGRGGFGFGTGGGDGGVSTGGTATFNLNGTATVDAGTAIVSTTAFGGIGGDSSAPSLVDPDQGGGDGGNATGGNATFNDVSGTLTFGSMTVESSGLGGEGGTSFGASIGEAMGDGGAGGTGTGGTALVALNQDNANPNFYTVLAVGVGGDGGGGNSGGIGGAGQGGEARVEVNDVNVRFDEITLDVSGDGGQGGFVDGRDLNAGAMGGSGTGGIATLQVSGAAAGITLDNLIQMRATATGGTGGNGAPSNVSTDPGTDGGQGGTASGGTAQFVAINGANLTLDSATMEFEADAFGGLGGDGGSNFVGGAGGTGGDGGDATGGTLAIVATTGAAIDLQGAGGFSIGSVGTGGDGGQGGDIDMLSGGAGGTGGNGGAGTGGSPTLSATGATITGVDIDIDAQGFGGNGGLGGDDGLIVLGADGNGGAGTGGAPLIEVVEGSPGIITLGDVVITATGTGGTGTTVGLGDGGQITIRDLSPDPAGLISFGDLDVIATGDPTATGGSLTFESGSGPITINGNLNADVAGDIVFNMDGTGQVLVTSAAVLTATQDITGTHTNNAAGNASIDAGAVFLGAATRDFLFGEGTLIEAGTIANLSGQNVSYDDITSGGTVDVIASNGSITGTSTGTITASNVLDAIDLLALQDVTFGNLVSVAGNIDVDAVNGGITGVNVNSAQSILLNAAGLIAVENIQHTNAIGLMNIVGGSVDIGTLNSNFITNVTSTTGDLAIDNLTNSDSTALTSAGSIALGTANIGGINADAVGDFSVDTLTTSATAAIDFITAGGTATYGTITSSRGLNITANVISGGGDIATTGLGGVALDAEQIDIGDIAIATTGSISVISNSDSISAGNLSTAQGSILVDSADAVTLGDATSSSTTRINAIGDVTVGDVNAAGSTIIDTDGNLTAGDLVSTVSSPGLTIIVDGDADIASATANGVFNVNVAGALTGGSFSGLGSASNVAITASSIDIASAESTNQNVNVTATAGDAIVGLATSSGNTTITGENVTLGSGDVGSVLTLNATAGDVTSTGVLNVGGVVDFDATGNINAAGADISGTIVNLTAGGDITANSVEATLSSSANNVTLNAGGALDLESVTAANNIIINSDIVDIGTMDAGGSSSTVIATGAVAIDNAISTGNTTISGTTIALVDSDVGGNLSATATNGDVTVDGDLMSGAVISLDASQNVNIASGASLDSAGTINIDALGNVTFTGADLSAAVVNMDVGGDLVGGALLARLTSANNTVDLTAGGTIDVDSITAANNILLDAAAIDVGTLDAVFITAATTGTLSVGNAISDNNTTLSGTSVNIDAGTIGGDLNVTSTVGDITGSGTITVIGSAFLNAAQSIAIGTLDANTITLFANTDVLFDSLISPNDIEIDATGGNIGASVAGGGNITTDGDVDLTSLTMSVGDVTALGMVEAAANGDASFGNVDAGTTITIISTGTPSVASVTSGGDTIIAGADVELNGGDVGGNLGLFSATGDIVLALDGADQIVVGGITLLDSAGGISISHTNNTGGVLSLDSTGLIDMEANGDIVSTAGSIISSDGQVDIRSESNLSIADVRGVGIVDLSAFGDATVNDATLSGAVGTVVLGAGTRVTTGLTITAGGNNDLSLEQFDPSATATVTGDVTSTGFVRVEAGGNAVFQSGSTTVSDNGLTVGTGDDIIIEAGALVEAAAGPNTTPSAAVPFSSFNNLVLDAGELRASLLTTALTPLSSVVIEGTVDANTFAAVITGNAIDGLGGTIIASSFSADVNDAPAAGAPQSDDFGLLSTACLEGNICLGNINANNQILIGQFSNNDTIQLIVEQGTVNANTILITTREDIVMGTNGIATVLNATDTFSATSLTGNVDLRDAAIASDQILIDAAGSLIGSASLISANDIGITVGGSIAAASIITDGELTDVANVGGAIEGFYGVPGDFAVGFFSQGATDINISAGGDINVGEAASPGDVILSADGDVFLGLADVPGQISLTGQNAGFDTLTGANGISIDALSGSITGTGDLLTTGASAAINLDAADDIDVQNLTSAHEASLDAGGNIAFANIDAADDVFLTAVGDITGLDVIAGNNGALITGSAIDLGNIQSVGLAQIDGTSIAVGEVSAAFIDFTSASDILFDLLQSPNAITLSATNGVIGANNGPGDIVSDDDVTLDALEIAINDVTALGDVTANATGGDASFGVVDATNDITITASGTPSVLNAISGGNTSITGASVTLDNGTIGGDLALNATAGNIDGNGSVSVAGGIDFTATGNVGFGNLDAQGGSFVVDAGGDITFASATSTDTLDFTAAGSVNGGDLDALNAISIDASNIALGDVMSGQIDLTSATDILFDSITSPNALTLTAANGVIGANNVANLIDSGGAVTLEAESIAVDTILAGGAVTASATVGELNLGNVTSIGLGTSIQLNAADNINAGVLTTDGGDILISSGQDIALASAATSAGTPTGGTIGLLAGGNVTASGLLSAGEDVAVRALGDATLADVLAGDDIAVTADGSITLGNATTSGAGIDLFGLVFNTANAGQANSILFGTQTLAGSNINLNGAAIDAGDVTSSGAINAGAAVGGASFGTIDAADDVDVSAAGAATIAALNSGMNSTVTGSSVNVGGGTVGGDLELNATGDDLDATGTFTVSGAISLSASGDVTFGTLDAQGGSFAVTSGGSIDFDTASATGLVDFAAVDAINGGDISSDTEIDIDADTGSITVNDLTADGPINVGAAGDFTANDITQTDGNLDVVVDGNVNFASASGASGAAFITGPNGSVTGDTLSSDNQVLIDTGTGGANIGTLTTGDADVFADNGAVAIDDAMLTGLLVAEGSEITIGSSTALNVDAVATAGNVDVQAAGDLDAVADATGDLALVSLGGDAIITGGTGQNITLSAGGDLDVGGDVIASADLTMDAGGTFILGADAIGQTITVNSSDVVITADGQLGDATLTGSITFNGIDEMFLGGAGGSGALYEIDNDEFTRIHSGGDIVVSVIGAGTGLPALITVDTLDIVAGDGSSATGQNIGQASGLVLQSEGDIAVIGDASITNATIDTLFIAEAAELVFVNSETGGIFITDANAGLAGVIEITATDFNAVTDAAFADIQGMSVADIDLRLADSDGVDRPDGVLRADTLDIDTTASQVFIQNTALGMDFADRRGFDVNTLLISDSGGTIQPIVINGLVGGVAGIDTVPLVTITSTFDAASTINGCLIANVASCAPIIIGPVTPQAPNDPSRDVIEEGLDPEDTDEATGSIQTGLLEFSPDFEFGTEPLIDEPVTGAGNEDLWVDPDCPPGADPEVCAAEPAE